MSNLTTQIKNVLDDTIAQHITPGAVVGVFKNGQKTIIPAGSFTYEPDSPSVTNKTIYDVASITKSVAAGLLALKAIEEQKISPNTKLTSVLPDFTGTHHDEVTVHHLLTYTVISDIQTSTAELSKQGGEALIETLKKTALKSPPGTEFAYINTPVIMLTLLLETVYESNFYDLVQQKIFKPLHMNSSTFFTSKLSDEHIPPTENVDGQNIHKIVHDESARAMQQDGYQTGHAGMFSTVDDLLNVCEMIVNNGTFNNSQFLQPELIKKMTTNQLDAIGRRSGLGWEMDDSFFRGLYKNPNIIGKTGFTGCSITINPTNQSSLVILSNAKYPDRSTTRDQIIKFRLKLLKTCGVI
ncbi:TPA: class A beta-lactamase-related serine hydrolase [Candidatus Saccharibacteria bacterium]|nr:class A beta-lactamase-related serine hydrolase [Candidatus Saccharibacteria bacterium]HIO87669.1 class A beta-lactamase-related serine hydrolase [Candidatus Saccharibacteria bacterium]